MLIATLPTLTCAEMRDLSEKIIKHPLIKAVRYNTGGDSPYEPKAILESLKPIADSCGKPLYVDLEGRQVRVANWTPFSRGAVVLNQDFDIELPAQIYFRRAGWCDIVNALPEERKIFFRPHRMKEEYYLGTSQSANIVAKRFKIKGYLQDLDFEYIKAAAELDINHFMLSFVESLEDVSEFYGAYKAYGAGRDLSPPQLVLKIESLKGLEFIKNTSRKVLASFQLMAARDDLFLGFIDRRSEFLDALKLIIKKDKRAILASKIMSGLLEEKEITIGDMTDMVLMNQFGYENFMLPDELTDCFNSAMQDWQEIIIPILGGKRTWKKK